jgi:hypothetical protein
MGRGWDLFGTAHAAWTPFYPEYVVYLQVVLLLVGLYYGLRTGYRFARERFGNGSFAVRAFAPVALLITLVSCGTAACNRTRTWGRAAVWLRSAGGFCGAFSALIPRSSPEAIQAVATITRPAATMKERLMSNIPTNRRSAAVS